MNLTQQKGFPTKVWDEYHANKRYEQDRDVLRVQARLLRAKIYATKNPKTLEKLKLKKTALDGKLKELNTKISAYNKQYKMAKIKHYIIIDGIRKQIKLDPKQAKLTYTYIQIEELYLKAALELMHT